MTDFASMTDEELNRAAAAVVEPNREKALCEWAKRVEIRTEAM